MNSGFKSMRNEFKVEANQMDRLSSYFLGSRGLSEKHVEKYREDLQTVYDTWDAIYLKAKRLQ
eukprot:Pgem_evm1s9191